MWKKILTSIFAICLTVTILPIKNVNASEGEQKDKEININEIYKEHKLEFDTWKKVQQYFVILPDNKMGLSEDLNILTGKLSLSVQEVTIVENIVNKYNSQLDTAITPTPSPRIHIDGLTVYCTYNDLVDFFGVAGAITVGGIASFLSLVGSVVPGIGTAIGALFGVLGGVAIANTVYDAMSQKKGIYIRAFPLAIGVWK